MSLVAALATALVSSQWALAADNTPPAQATPGTDQAQDSKTQQNNPPSSANQSTASTPQDSKDNTATGSGPGPNGTDQNGVGPKTTKKHHKHKTTTTPDNGTTTTSGTSSTTGPQ